MYVRRSEYIIDGKIPYLDFQVNKPPLYIYMLHFLGSILTPGFVQFRSFFSIIDAAVAVSIFYLCKNKFDDTFSFKASLAYAICPLPIIFIGLSGHYEPVVVVPVIFSTIFLLKEKYKLSALLLGFSFALKFFPIVLLPFFAWKVQTWRKRVLYVIIFSIPFMISVIPILISSYDAFLNYLVSQTVSWEAKKSFPYIFEMLTGSKYFLGLKTSLLNSIFFFLLIFIMFACWVRHRFNPNTWLKIIIIIYILYYGFVGIVTIKFYQSGLQLSNPYVLMAIIAIIYFPGAFFIYDRYIKSMKFEIKNEEIMYVLAAFSIIFLLFSSSQFNPWYVLWVIPFILAIKNWKIRMILFFMVVWNFEGLGLSLLPGLGIG
jgi:hypothetical protein